MSIYATVLRLVKDNPAQTEAQLATLNGNPHDDTSIVQVLVMLVADGRVTKSGSGAGATYSSTSQQ